MGKVPFAYSYHNHTGPHGYTYGWLHGYHRPHYLDWFTLVAQPIELDQELGDIVGFPLDCLFVANLLAKTRRHETQFSQTRSTIRLHFFVFFVRCHDSPLLSDGIDLGIREFTLLANDLHPKITAAIAVRKNCLNVRLEVFFGFDLPITGTSEQFAHTHGNGQWNSGFPTNQLAQLSRQDLSIHIAPLFMHRWEVSKDNLPNL